MYIENIDILKQRLLEIQTDEKIKAILLLGGDKNQPETDELKSILSLNHKPLLGGIFPEIIADGERRENGFVIIPFHEEMQVIGFKTLENKSITKQIENRKLSSIAFKSIFCFTNALWQEKTTFIHALYDECGPFVSYLGGGAGSLSFKSFPCIFANQEIIEHGSVIGMINSPVFTGVAHGWHPISDVIKVTESQGNTIVSLNWKPAFEVYKSYVESHSNLNFTSQNFFDIAKSYPLGLVKLDDEMIIRDPYATENNKLHIVDEVRQGEYIRIMHGNMTSLLEGVKNAVHISEKHKNQPFTQLCIDCISRVLFMQSDFDEELKYLNKNQKANGILSIGEIANLGNTALELFNKTVVVAQWKTN